LGTALDTGAACTGATGHDAREISRDSPPADAGRREAAAGRLRRAVGAGPRLDAPLRDTDRQAHPQRRSEGAPQMSSAYGMREIILDTETTGLDPLKGDRLVEIGCVELINHLPTGRTWHTFINPQREVPLEAFEVHGLSTDFLADKPLFQEVCDPFLEFIGDAPLIIHNGVFDMGFLNAELRRLSRPALPMERLVCTLEMARKKFSGGQNSLDALCRRFGIDLSVRTKHGALVDCELLAEV